MTHFKPLSLTLLIVLLTMTQTRAQQKLPLKIATYNIRYENHNDAKAGNAWKNRLPVIADFLICESPDVVGMQEVLEGQFEDLKTQLPTYTAYGIGRADGKTAGEYAPIFYKKESFKLLDKGTFWLSETPEKPSKGWDAVLPRICSWVKLQHKAEGEILWVFNAHYDHVGVKARHNSSQLILQKIKEMTNEAPVVLLGDFNVDQSHSAYQIFEASDLLEDTYKTAEHRMAYNGTFNAFDSDLWTQSRIDHLFTTPNVEVTHYALLTPVYWKDAQNQPDVKRGNFPKEVSSKEAKLRLASDHFPVLIRVLID